MLSNENKEERMKIIFNVWDNRSREQRDITVIQRIFKDVDRGAFIGQMLIYHYEQLKEKGYVVRLTSFEVENV